MSKQFLYITKQEVKRILKQQKTLIDVKVMEHDDEKYRLCQELLLRMNEEEEGMQRVEDINEEESS